MSNAGNALLLLGVFVFYSFIGWGIASLYDEEIPTNEEFVSSMLSNNDNLTRCYELNFWERYEAEFECPVFGEGDAFYTISTFGSKTLDMLGTVLKVASYSNPHIPFLINLFIITPFNFLVAFIILQLIRGGGS